MKKVSKEAGWDEGLWDEQTARNTEKINEIVDWINEDEKHSPKG